MVCYAGDDALTGEILADFLLAGIGEGDEMAREIAAVDGGNVLRIERPEVDGIVPIVEVAAEPVHAAHRAKRRLKPHDHVVETDPAEIACRHGGEQVEADIGR